MSGSERLDNLLGLHLHRVRDINCSPVLGTPLAWGSEWGNQIPARLNGWSSGLLLISGQSNHGKSSVAVSLVLNFLRNNPDLWVVDFTMDDDLRDRLSKYVAILSGIPPDAIKMEYSVHQRFGRNAEAIDAYQYLVGKAYDDLSRLGRLIVLDSQTLYELLHTGERAVGIIPPTIENICQAVMKVHRYASGRGGQLLVLIDAINDIMVENGRHIGDNERLSRIGSELMALSQAGGIRIIATTHARKVTNWRRPSMDDVYGASALKYAAKVITFVYNDYKARRSDSSLTIDIQPHVDAIPFMNAYADSKPLTRTAPVLIWNFLKNKTSGLDGESFLMLDPFTTGVLPLDEGEWDYYRSLLYQ